MREGGCWCEWRRNNGRTRKDGDCRRDELSGNDGMRNVRGALRVISGLMRRADLQRERVEADTGSK